MFWHLHTFIDLSKSLMTMHSMVCIETSIDILTLLHDILFPLDFVYNNKEKDFFFFFLHNDFLWLGLRFC